MSNLKDFFSIKNLIGIIIFAVIITASIIVYYYINDSKNKKNILIEKNKVLILIDSSKTMENYNSKLLKEINNIKINPVNIFSSFCIMTLSKKSLVEAWTKDFYPESITLNFFGTSQINNLIDINSFDSKVQEADIIYIISTKFNNDGQPTISEETEKKILENKKNKIIKID